MVKVCAWVKLVLVPAGALMWVAQGPADCWGAALPVPASTGRGLMLFCTQAALLLSSL